MNPDAMWDARCQHCGQDKSVGVCCSAHGAVLCHLCYCRTHFYETCPCAECEAARTVPA